MRERKVTSEALCDYVKVKLDIHECSKDELALIKKTLSTFNANFEQRWKQCSRNKDRFLQKYKKWLKTEIKFPEKIHTALKSSIPFADSKPSVSGIGRPRKSFEDAGIKTKRKIVRSLVKDFSQDELAFATRMSMHASGKRDAASVLQQITETTPRRASRYKKAFETPPLPPLPYTADEALAYFINNRFTKQQYVNTRLGAKERRSDIYPPYNTLVKAKLACYPPSEAITVSETSAEIQLQALLDHTISRLVSVQEEVFERVLNCDPMIFKLICKWGCDGSGGHKQYKQKFINEGEEQAHDDSDMFVISLVPLQLYCTEDVGTEKIILWQNSRSSSTRFCRPIKVLLEKESKEITLREINKIKAQIQNLTPTKIDIRGREINIETEMLFTMVDGKICNAIAGSSSQKCYICGCTPKQMNDIKQITDTAVPDVTMYSFGLSTLHAWIRFLECLLHISYRIGVKKWQVKGKDDKQQVAQRKEKVVKSFRQEMGLIIDQPKPGGFGSTNDGNTARRFFKEPNISATITGIDEELIRRFSIILRVISSGFAVNVDAFDKYALETANLYVKLYPWYYMPASVHKILIHGGRVIESAILPIGMLSEEAQEARHKHLRKYREGHSRKISRIETMQDVLNLLLVTSDPVISQISIPPRHKRESLPQEVSQLLKEPEVACLTTRKGEENEEEPQEEMEEEEEKEEEEDDDDDDDDACFEDDDDEDEEMGDEDDII